MKNALFRLSLALLALAALSGCSSSNNLSNPSNAAVSATSCDPTQSGCIEGQFVDEVVQNLDYSCASTTVSIHSVTDENGFFTCPTGSTVTFFIGFPGSNNQIVLGQAVMNARTVPSAVAGASGGSGIVQITPLDLAGYVFSTRVGTGSPANNGNAATTNQYVINLVRFLKALDSQKAWQSPSYVPYGAGNYISISNDARAIVANGSNGGQGVHGGYNVKLTDTDFTGSDLSDKLKAFLQEANSGAVPDDVKGTVVMPQFANTLNTLNAGVYVSNGLWCNSFLFDYGMCNVGSGRQAGDLMLFVDRTGYASGFGITTTSADITASPAPFYVTTGSNSSCPNTTAQPIANGSDSRALGAFCLTANTDPNAGNSTNQNATLQWTGIMAEGAIASTSAVYQNIYGETPTEVSSQLGIWTYKNSPADSTNDVSSGQYFLLNSKPVNALLTTAVWSQQTFPIQLDISFYYHDSTCTTSSDPTVNFCKKLILSGTSNTFPISILQNGNIISRLGGGCNTSFASDPNGPDIEDTSSGTQTKQYRLGFVSTITSNSELSLTLLFPHSTIADTTFAAAIPDNLQGVVAGTSSQALIHLPTALSPSGETALTIPLSSAAAWGNYFNSTTLAGETTKTGAAADIASGIFSIAPATTCQGT